VTTPAQILRGLTTSVDRLREVRDRRPIECIHHAVIAAQRLRLGGLGLNKIRVGINALCECLHGAIEVARTLQSDTQSIKGGRKRRVFLSGLAKKPDRFAKIGEVPIRLIAVPAMKSASEKRVCLPILCKAHRDEGGIRVCNVKGRFVDQLLQRICLPLLFLAMWSRAFRNAFLSAVDGTDRG
jgi:hypothetical protein